MVRLLQGQRILGCGFDTMTRNNVWWLHDKEPARIHSRTVVIFYYFVFSLSISPELLGRWMAMLLTTSDWLVS